MRSLAAAIVVVLAILAVVFVVTQDSPVPLQEGNLDRQSAERAIREMSNDELTATTTEAIEKRLRLAQATAWESNRINITNCNAFPFVLKVRSDEEIKFDNVADNKLTLLFNERDYYIIQPNSFLILKANFKTEDNDNLVRYFCGEGGGAASNQGFILLNKN